MSTIAPLRAPESAREVTDDVTRYFQSSVSTVQMTWRSPWEAAAFFSESELPELSVGRLTLWQAHRLFEHHRNPNLPTDFDAV